MNKGTSRQEEDHNWFPLGCRSFVANHVSKRNKYVIKNLESSILLVAENILFKSEGSFISY